jgi:CHRD domain
MKKIFAILLSSAAICQASLIPMGISPSGTDAAIGLNPSNEVPAVSNSTGSGGSISGGLVFDTDSSSLMVTVGYGSAAGFTDLTGPATSMTLNGPAGTNQNGAELFDLSVFSFPAVNPAQGGVIFGSVTFPTNAVGDLLAGFDYINIGTDSNTNGEIRGQLIVLTPTITCPAPNTNECGTVAVVPVTVSDPAGNAMTVVWSLNGVPVQTNQVAASNPPAATSVTFTGELPLGTNLVEVMVTDSANYSASCSTTVTVVDTMPPVITKAGASPSSLWPPNHKMVTVTISATVTDNCDSTSWHIIQVQSNEPVNGKGDGNTAPDWLIFGNHKVELRAERSGTGSGRVYTITIQASDASGNLSDPKTVTVTVPKSQGKNK